MNGVTVQPGELAEPPARVGIQRIFPGFWTVLLCLGLLVSTLGLVASHPERLQGWRAVGLCVLLVSMVRSYQWLSRERIYGSGNLPERQALIPLGFQLVALFFLILGYDSSFAWFSVCILYQILGGFSRRYWLLPLAGVLVMILAALIPIAGNAPINSGAVASGILLFVTNVGIALFIRLMIKQREQLMGTLERLRQAYGALTISAAQTEELTLLRERTRLARLMHDEIGRALVVINIKLEAAQLLYKHDPARGDAELEATRALVRSSMAELRHALADLRAPTVDYDDLPVALKRLAQEIQHRTGLVVTCPIASDLPVPPTDTRKALWYAVGEALTNVERHAAATCVTVTFEAVTNGWSLCITDDGRGVTPDDLCRSGHYGVLGMREYIQAVEGTVSIRPGATKGTVVEITVPAPIAAEMAQP